MKLTYKEFMATPFLATLQAMEDKDRDLIIDVKAEDFNLCDFLKRIPEVRQGGLSLDCKTDDKGITTIKFSLDVVPTKICIEVDVEWKVNTFDNLLMFAKKIIEPLVYKGLLGKTKYLYDFAEVDFQSSKLRGVLIELIQFAMWSSMSQFEEEISDEMLDKICIEAK